MFSVLFNIFLFPFILCSNQFYSSISVENDIKKIENYTYYSFPQGTNAAGQKGVMKTEMTFTSLENKFIYSEKTTSEDKTELKEIGVDKFGDFVWATRKLFKNGETFYQGDSLVRDRNLIHIFSSDEKRSKKKSITLPNEMPIAVDASLLFLLRIIPFDRVKEKEVFMVDYSGHRVKVNVRSFGEEIVTVPGGTFSCLRIEVAVNILIFRPKITYWIANGEPRFLVKHYGKKGPFTPVYTTVLYSINKSRD